jgi:hypothetical protein
MAVAAIRRKRGFKIFKELFAAARVTRRVSEKVTQNMTQP